MNEPPESRRLQFLAYFAFTFFSYFIFVTPSHAAISVIFFTICQFLWFLYFFGRKKELFMFIPIAILSLNSFLSANAIWKVSNFFVTIVLYAVMLLMLQGNFSFCQNSLEHLLSITECIYVPAIYAKLPLNWSIGNSEKRKNMRRVFIAILISIPIASVVFSLLLSADFVFASLVLKFMSNLNVMPMTLLKLIFSLLMAFYFFGLVFRSFVPTVRRPPIADAMPKFDILFVNTPLITVLFLYTMFIFIQFKYLFAGAQLPYGLSYAEYARRGFFELLFLTGVNILFILLAQLLTRTNPRGSKLTKILCLYLCAVTVVLLISSFYRMNLYNQAFGFTRLRYLVTTFLAFELLGLLLTFWYILKPKFNIILCYSAIALAYYLFLNLVPMDYFIAKHNIDMHFDGNSTDVTYLFSLSADAAPQIARLFLEDASDPVLKERAYRFINSHTIDTYYRRYVFDLDDWQRFNFSIYRASQYLN